MADGPPEKNAAGEAPGETLRIAYPARVRALGKLLAVPALAMLGLAPLGWLVDGPPTAWAVLAAFPASIALLFTAPALMASFLASSYYGAGGVRFNGVKLSYDEGAELLASEIAMVWRQDARRVQIRTVDGRTFHIKLVHAEDTDRLAHTIQRARQGNHAYPLPIDGDALRLVKEYFYWVAPTVLAVPLIAASPLLAPVAAALALATGILGMRRHPALLLGADGVRIQTRLRSRFVRYADIGSVDNVRHWLVRRIVITLHDGQRVTFNVADRARAQLMLGLLREGMQMHELGIAAGAGLAALEGGDDLKEWKQRAESAVMKGADYRAAAVEPQKLEWLMRNPAASPTQRVGAALAMRNAPAGRKQIRVAADVSTDPAVKEALELLGSEEAELDAPALERVLARVRRE